MHIRMQLHYFIKMGGNIKLFEIYKNFQKFIEQMSHFLSVVYLLFLLVILYYILIQIQQRFLLIINSIQRVS